MAGTITKKVIVGAAALLAGGGVVWGAASVAAADPATPVARPASTASGKAGPEKAGSQLAEVTGDEAEKVSAAVKAKDSAVTVERVMKHTDGSYRVRGTKDGSRVGFTVSTDLQTVTQKEQKEGQGRRGDSQLAEVTGDEAEKVSAAVKAKDSAVTVERVMKHTDGSYRVRGTKDGSRVGFTVSTDLQTITQHR